MKIFLTAIFFWIFTWAINEWLVRRHINSPILERMRDIIVPVLFGAALLALWEGVTVGFKVPTILLPPPSMIWERITNSTQILWVDFQQTFMKAALIAFFWVVVQAFW